ncbi:MAG: pyridoxal phosphate-dependent aminotransferase [Bacteroidota bacterium]
MNKRLKGIPGFSIDQVADAAGNDPDVLRLENLDTDLPAPLAAIEATRKAVGQDKYNSYLPFIGQESIRHAIAQKLNRQTRQFYHANNVVITSGGTNGMFNALLALTDPGEEVILTDPTYAGMIQRVRLAGGIPKLVPFRNVSGEWRLDIDQLRDSVSERTRALFIMNPSMPSGAVLNQDEWQQIADLCRTHELWLIYNAAMERILFDGRKVIHPAALYRMFERTIIVGSISKEYRMIGWRLGWLAAPAGIIDDLARVSIYNAVTPSGIAQAAALEALKESSEDYTTVLQTWEARRNKVNEQLADYPMISAAGGWSQLVDMSQLDIDGPTASRLLLRQGKVAATPMTHWGAIHSNQYIRLVFSNESVERLSTLGDRFRKTFG